MKILMFYKRHNMGIDSLLHAHGRMNAIHRDLLHAGNQVHIIVSDYHPSRSAESGVPPESSPITLFPLNLKRLPGYFGEIENVILEWQPDAILAGSDALQIIAASLLARKHGNIPFFADLKDNYEYFGITQIPMINSAFNKALNRAAGVICVSVPLQRYISKERQIYETFLYENLADETMFHPINQEVSRKKLGLPPGTFLIGTAGALKKSRGIKILFRAFEQAIHIHPSSALVVAGPRDNSWSPITSYPFIDLGILEPSKVPDFFSALDVGVICNLDSSFGKFCYPQKYSEMLACGLPVITSNTGIFSEEIKQPGIISTYNPLNSEDLRAKIEDAHRSRPPRTSGYQPQEWKERAARLSEYLGRQITNNAGR